MQKWGLIYYVPFFLVPSRLRDIKEKSQQHSFILFLINKDKYVLFLANCAADIEIYQ